MPDRPRAIVSFDVPGADGPRTVTITVPALVEQFRAGERLGPAVEDRILVDMRGALDRLGVALEDGACVIVERVDGHLAWCRVTRP
jgi:hypothetical protein